MRMFSLFPFFVDHIGGDNDFRFPFARWFYYHLFCMKDVVAVQYYNGD